MASTRDLRRKIASVKATGKLTRAMQMVAASKMNRATAAATSSRRYADEAWAVIGELAERTNLTHPLFALPKSGKRAIIVIASNRGLAGSFNTQVIRLASSTLDATTDLITVGRKALQYFRRFRPDNLKAEFPASDATPTSADVTPIAQLITKKFLDGEYQRVDVVYNQFVSTLVQRPVTEQLLPIKPEASTGEATDLGGEFTIEPSPSEVLSALAERIVPLRLFQMLLESAAAEHSARMVAMKSATDNAKEIVGDLTLTYQSIRQANITREIIEVAAGANALAQ